MQPQKNTLLNLWASFLIIIATAIWGSSFVFMKTALDDMPTIYFLFFRFLLATIILAICCNKKLRQINKRFLIDSIYVSLPLAAGFILQTIGLKATTVGNVAFITGIYVVFVPLLGYFFFKRITIYQILIGIVTFIGLAIFSFDANMHTNYGDTLVLISSVAYALHFLVVCKITNRYDSMLLTFGQIAGATIFYGIVASIMEPMPTAANFTNNVFFALVFCALLSTCVAFFIQIYAQKILSPTQASVIFTAEVFFGAFFGWLLLGELFSTRQFLGAGILAVCMITVILIPWLEMRRSKSNSVKFDV